MRKVLSISYSQTGQLFDITNSVLKPLLGVDEIEVEQLVLQPNKPFPFPWPFLHFFRIMPETVQMEPIELAPLQTQQTKYDLIILSYQVWFLSPSLPISAFLQTEQAQTLFHNTPVVTLIGCRGMWLSAQEKVKALLSKLQARLVDNAVLTDDCGAGFSFLATPLWMFTGNKKPVSWIPRAGVSEQQIDHAQRFGNAIRVRLQRDNTPIKEPMLKGLAAVQINEKLIASEKIGSRSFQIWSKILKRFGRPNSIGRTLGLCVYITFLITLILTVVPVSALIKKLLSPLAKKKTSLQKEYYAQPSGE